MAAFDCEGDLIRTRTTLLLGMALCMVAGASAQVDSSASLRGVVLDPSGAFIPRADVVIFSEGKNVAHVQAGEDGHFAFTAPAREYQVKIHVDGFTDLRSGPVPFSPGSETRFTLQVGSGGPGVEAPPTAGVPAHSTPAQGVLQESPVRQVSRQGQWEYGVLGQGGVGTSDRSGYKFFLLGGHAGKVLTPNLGSGLLQGNFEYAVEVFPFWQSYTPRFQRVSCLGAVPVGGGTGCGQPYTVGGTYTGVSVTPIELRWNLTHGERWMPWVQGAGGVVWTNHKYPPIGNLNTADIASNGPAGDTSVWNFTPQFGVGTHYFLRPRRSLDFSANAVHISSASLGDKNPGVNASVQFSVGYTWWK